MEYKRSGRKILLRLNPGEGVAECTREMYRIERVVLGKVSGLGATSETESGVLDTTKEKYCGKSLKGNYEIASLTGSVAQQGENPYFHLHMVIGNPLVGGCHGGHLDRAVINATAEIFIVVIGETVGRRMNESIGLNLTESTQA